VNFILKFFSLVKNESLIEALRQAIIYVNSLITAARIELIRIRHGETVVRTVQGSKMELDVSAQPMKARMLLKKELDSVVTKTFRNILGYEYNQTENTIYVFELGAHHGYYSLLAAQILGQRGEIYAVEPSPDNIARIQTNRDLNNYPQIEVIQGAIGADRDVLELNLQERSYKNRVQNRDLGESNTVEIEIYSLDQIVDEYEIPHDEPLVIRMDVEYYENEAIEGMEELLTSGQKMYILAEIHRSDDYKGEQTISKLEDYGFDITYLNPQSPPAAVDPNTNLEILASKDVTVSVK